VAMGGALPEAVEAAEAAYQVASRWGREPQPGLALLRLAQGRTEAGEAAIRRVLAETGDRLERARLLAAATEILLATGDLGGAREAADELGRIAGDYRTLAMELAAARTVLAGLGAGPDLERLDRLAGAAPAAGGLTGRGLEVLRLWPPARPTMPSPPACT
jgi:hypothetical protein